MQHDCLVPAALDASILMSCMERQQKAGRCYSWRAAVADKVSAGGFAVAEESSLHGGRIMDGPYDLELVRDYVKAGSIGVYMLGRYGDYVHYIGRSDTDLQAEILNAALYRGRRCLYFWFEYATSAMRAYKRECELWHHYYPPDNRNHPAKPWDTNWRCPVSDCRYS